MKILSMNIRGLGSVDKLKLLRAVVFKEKLDLLALQGTCFSEKWGIGSSGFELQ